MKKALTVSISLITYNSYPLLKRCLISLLTNPQGVSFEILLVDNGSTDETPKKVRREFPQVKLLVNSYNALYTKAHNQNLRRARGRYVLVLNDDVIIPKLTLKKIVAFMEKNPTIGIAGCVQKDALGKIEKTATHFPHPMLEFFDSTVIGRKLLQIFKFTRIKEQLHDYRYCDWDRTTTRPIGAASGSFFMIRKTLLSKIGLFDENMKLYFEELDYCIRALRVGFKTYHVASASIIHLHTQTISKLPTFMKYQIAQHDTLAFYKKYFGFWWYLFLWTSYRPNWILWKIKSIRT